VELVIFLWHFVTLLLIVGRKGRSYLLILLRLNQLTMETVDESIFYLLRLNQLTMETVDESIFYTLRKNDS
jgi:hypothetical protein